MSIRVSYRQQGSTRPEEHPPLTKRFSTRPSLQSAHDEDLNLWDLNPSSDEILPNNMILLFIASHYNKIIVHIYNE